ncbi:DUF5590 domain-containing protein [Limosilactobacillus secaliphilus]|uniref:Cell wall elongation regulator TseB-like domain-containing protein n=1 Tax=Limosilactobacillus secaliphilus TaxID=396268 RepID=A0A0R2I1M5_9LACO|nr:DUF5590 domain-containing protein [Limosilactobacillus secaliphilus]KRN59072.1 hypothetical protein IV45_GL000108 [Limosilactobacillus secaliphilus]
MQSRRDVQRKQDHSRAVHTLKWTLITVLVLILVVWSSLAIANHPKQAAQRQATQMARRYGHLTSTNDFYIFNREKTYYTVAGKNKRGQQTLVIVPQNGGDIHVVKQSKGISGQDAINKVKSDKRPKKIMKAAPGYFNDRLVWEVTYVNRRGSMCYDLINFKTGNYVQQIDNL